MHLTARQAAEKYGLAIRKNGMVCCPFHRDKHPSMKIDKNYHCFACGIGGDAIDYVSRMFGLTQYQAAKKLIDDFSLMVEHGRKMALSAKEKEKIIRARQENERIIRIKKRFGRWCSESIGLLRNCIDEIRQAGILLTDKAQNQIFTDDYTS
ncbi:CHC2 zinc finger domain protein, partial [Catonella morbi ATCC 51271]